MKYNMGCGFNKIKDFINVDKFAGCNPDMLMDLEHFPWPIKNDSADEILFNHSLEHIGQTAEIFLNVMKEIYRVSADGAKIFINAPHPRHDFFLGDPTHVRVISPMVLSLFSKKNNIEWKKINAANSPLATYIDVDFDIVECVHVLDPRYQKMFDSKEVTGDQLVRFSEERNNVIQEYRIVLRVIK